jgi:transcriptional regulator with XRE-family HTH domain
LTPKTDAHILPSGITGQRVDLCSSGGKAPKVQPLFWKVLKGDERMVMDERRPVGQRIRLAREERGLSVKELASKAGCLDEYLEWVEDGQVEPPVALLIQLARALKLDSASFLEVDGSPGRRLKEAAKRTEHYSYNTLTPPDADSHLMAFSVTVPPKTAHKGVGYQHEGEEFVFVLSGEVEIMVDREITRLGEKQSLRFNSNLDHHLSNPGERDAELLIILYLP